MNTIKKNAGRKFYAMMTAVAVVGGTAWARPDGGLHSHGSAFETITNGLPAGQVSIREENGKRIIEGNGLPTHEMGQFPNRANPNAAKAVEVRYEVPLEPEANAEFVPARVGWLLESREMGVSDLRAMVF